MDIFFVCMGSGIECVGTFGSLIHLHPQAINELKLLHTNKSRQQNSHFSASGERYDTTISTDCWIRIQGLVIGVGVAGCRLGRVPEPEISTPFHESEEEKERRPELRLEGVFVARHSTWCRL